MSPLLGIEKMKAFMVTLLCLPLAGIPTMIAHAHAGGAAGRQPLDWSNDQIGQVFAPAGTGRKVSMGGKNCVVGDVFYFDVRDEYAFDIDETVWLDLEFHVVSAGASLGMIYDRNGVTPPLLPLMEAKHEQIVEIQLPQGTSGQWHRESIPLKRARFASLVGGFDFTIFAIDSFRYGLNSFAERPRQFTICNISLRRSYTTPVATIFGQAAIEIVDENGQRTPARMGIYDPSGRLPLPSEEAVTHMRGARVIALGPGAPPWPAQNRFVFYADGRYHTNLPVGEYELIVAKGPEYRLARQRFTVGANRTKRIKVELQRWTDMAAKGWYSGDGHIHYTRTGEHDDRTLQLLTRAEDLRVANILQFGDVANTYFLQYGWKPVAIGHKAPFVLVPGQEDPRTFHLGHTIQLNIREPVRDPARYLLYHKAFENVRAQGGTTGYAHVVDDPAALKVTVRGMAIDVPFGLVDFVEILSLHLAGTSTWFDFLNLGYKLSPSAGTDYPLNAIGAVRNYVKIDKGFTPQAWFDGLKMGRTFVTNGPMIEMNVNGQGMGSEIHVNSGEPLVIKAKAAINPDMDTLSSLELIEQGDVVHAAFSKSGAPQLALHHDLVAKQGTWFVLRARGKNPNVIALSGPVYVFVDGRSFWKCSTVPSIVARLKQEMQQLLKPPNQMELTQVWEARELDAKYWESQQGLLKESIDQAAAIYDDLTRRAVACSDHP